MLICFTCGIEILYIKSAKKIIFIYLSVLQELVLIVSSETHNWCLVLAWRTSIGVFTASLKKYSWKLQHWRHYLQQHQLRVSVSTMHHSCKVSEMKHVEMSSPRCFAVVKGRCLNHLNCTNRLLPDGVRSDVWVQVFLMCKLVVGSLRFWGDAAYLRKRLQFLCVYVYISRLPHCLIAILGFYEFR
jgi:hypothetical protein